MSVVVEHYNPEWPLQFEVIKKEYESYLQGADIVSIEHVGSTSIPGLAAKPIIDIDIIVTRPNIQPAVDALVANSFTYLGELGIVDRHCLKDPNQSPVRNTYICVEGSFQTRNHLGVRDTLRKNPQLRDEYAKVKLELAAKDTNIVDYIEAKGPIIQKVLVASGYLTEEELAHIHNANIKGERVGATKTERLVLREFVTADVDNFHALESIPEVVRYQTWPPRTKKQAHDEVMNIIKNSPITPRVHFELAVTLPSTAEFIGRVGANVNRSSEPPHADLWFSFMPASQGKGFATEAMKTFIPLLGPGLELEIECDPRNEGSVKMAERLGFERISLEEKAFECKGEWVGSAVYRKTV
jgi:GrpB-like predicted nucleotidyltransferase (UPF0157 family)/RimJ/RimL family protein N-acetyltransferase